MELKRTPGKWIAECDEHSNWHVLSEHDDWVVKEFSWSSEEEGDAKLTAAAPELLEALEAILDSYSASGRDDYPQAVAARAAIAKAKGQTQ